MLIILILFYGILVKCTAAIRTHAAEFIHSFYFFIVSQALFIIHSMHFSRIGKPNAELEQNTDNGDTCPNAELYKIFIKAGYNECCKQSLDKYKEDKKDNNLFGTFIHRAERLTQIAIFFKSIFCIYHICNILISFLLCKFTCCFILIVFD